MYFEIELTFKLMAYQKYGGEENHNIHDESS